MTTPSGEPIAIYANYAVHARGHVPDAHPGRAGADHRRHRGLDAKYVEDRFKGAVALWTPGAAGDQNPLFMANYNQDAPDVHDEGPAGWAILDVQSRRLGEEIVRVAKSHSEHHGPRRSLGRQQLGDLPGTAARRRRPQPGVPRAGWQAPAPSTVKMIDGDPVTIPLQLLMINDIAIAGVAGEVFTEIGQHVKQDSLFDRTVMVTVLPNGIGYIPTDKAYLLPSEKAVGNRLKPGCAEPAIVGEFQAMMKSYLPVWQAAR